ncbi:RNA polymerase sigma factor [Kiloniella laminariae]|uniref:RNA polymerase sigma factor n=1 Tax=Kiloniella laminariae TaxID=454162 RepID=UPI000364281F|nr:RNA polymerase sigma factor [Kiloniella laminariae]
MKRTEHSLALETAQSRTLEEDARLMSRVTQGDPFACRNLVQHHTGPLVGLALRMTGNRQEAEDIAQEAFVRLWKQSPDWLPQARISTWLYRVVHNLAIDAIRRSKRQNTTSDEKMEFEDPAPDQQQRIQQRDLAIKVETAISQLPERQRTAITLVHHRDMSNKEAASVMDISVDALESLLARGRRSLKATLEQHRHDLLGAQS